MSSKLTQCHNRIRDLEQQVTRLEARLSANTDKQLLLMQQLITAQETIEALSTPDEGFELHLNAPGNLAPVDCPLLIEIEPGVVTEARRTGFIRDRKGQMEYRLPNGDLVYGRFRWSYP